MIELAASSSTTATGMAFTDPPGSSNLKAWNGTVWVAVTPYHFDSTGKWVLLDPQVEYHNGTTWLP